ncbi:MAG: hypothetical protein ACYDGR_07735 [Candidatus Dormibacteria bacterium]
MNPFVSSALRRSTSLKRLVQPSVLVGMGLVVGGLIARAGLIAQGLGSLRPPDYIEILRTVLEVAGGVWALYLYRARRQGQGSLTISHSFRTYPAELSAAGGFLILGLTITNTRLVLLRDLTARVTLMDASQADPTTGDIVLAPFGERDPFADFNDPTGDDGDELVGLEPGDQVDAEVAFRLDRIGLMAVRVAIEGKQGSTDEDVFLWNTFFYVDPALVPSRQGSSARIMPRRSK